MQAVPGKSRVPPVRFGDGATRYLGRYYGKGTQGHATSTKGKSVRGIKAKRLRKAGLKSGPRPRKEPTEQQVKKIEAKIANAKIPYERTTTGSRDGWALSLREKIIRNRKTGVTNGD